VKLQNVGSGSVDLKGWILDDGALGEGIGTSAFTLGEGSVDPGDEIEIVIPKSRFAMNNSGTDSVRLFSPDKTAKDYVSYEKPKEGVPYVKSGEAWAWHDETLEEEGEVAGIQLARTGFTVSGLAFATFPVIWYIASEVIRNKKPDEQARSHRRISSQARQQSN
jgi:hypothetical protein